MSLLTDITGAVNGLMASLPELTGTLVTKDGDSVTVIFTQGYIMRDNSALGALDATASTFDILQENILSVGMDLGDTVSITDSQGLVTRARLTAKSNSLNFVTFTFEAVNQ
jgi:hypothetical protein